MTTKRFRMMIPRIMITKRRDCSSLKYKDFSKRIEEAVVEFSIRNMVSQHLISSMLFLCNPLQYYRAVRKVFSYFCSGNLINH